MLNYPPVKVIIETNPKISFLIGKELAYLQELIVSQRIQVVFCEQIKEEINRVTQRPKLQKYFSAEKVKELLEFLGVIAVCI